MGMAANKAVNMDAVFVALLTTTAPVAAGVRR